MENIPDRCLICYSINKANGRGRAKKKTSLIATESLSSSSLFSKQLINLFILRNLLEIPSQNLQAYLMSWGNPEGWIFVCSKCDTIIEEAKRIHYELVDTNRRFKRAKKKVIEAIRKSKAEQNSDGKDLCKIPNRIITDQSRNFVSIHDYGHFINPFNSGDRRANQLVMKISTLPENTEAVNVKTEATEASTYDVLDDCGVDDASLFDDISIQNIELEDDFNIDELEIDSGKDTTSLSNVDVDTTKAQNNAVSEVSTSGENPTIETKFCQKCQVSFLANMYEKHEKNLHKPESDLQENHVGTGTKDSVDVVTENVTQEDRIKPVTETNLMILKEDYPPNARKKVELGEIDDKDLRIGERKALHCYKCPRKFSYQKDLMDHQDLHLISPYHCICCLSVHRNADNLRFHMWKNHPSTRIRKYNTKDRKNDEVDAQIFEEDQSHKKPRISTAEMRDVNVKQSPHHCTACGNVFVNKRKLLLHLEKYHRSLFEEYGKKVPPSPPAEQSSEATNEIPEPDASEIKKRRSTRQSVKKASTNSREKSNPSDSDEDNGERKRCQDTDWDPGHKEAFRTSISAPKRKIGHPRRSLPLTPLMKKTFLVCQTCSKFRFKIREADKLLDHLENCEAMHKDTNAEHTKKILACPLCENYEVPYSERVSYCEHLMACNYKESFDYIPISCRIFECSLCSSKKYFTLDSFLKHFVEHNGNIFKCTKCPRKFPVTTQIQSHWKSHHTDAMKNVQPLYRYVKEAAVPEVHWWCKFCNHKFTNEDARDDHIHSTHKLEVPQKLHIHVCQECSKAYTCQDELQLHEGTAHVANHLNIMYCEMCKQRFVTAQQLRNHRMRKHRLDLLVCEVCGTECNSIFNLRTHMQLHQDVKEFVCQQCGLSFTTRPYLRNHTYKEHAPLDAKLNPLVCPHCDKAFHNKSYLNEHIAGIHQGQFKMHCHVCNAGFHNNSQLKKHLARKHKIGEMKKYACTINGCDKKFHCISHLNNHISRHTGEPKFSCQFCEKKFYTRTHWRRHELIHTNSESKPYQCELCAKRFPVRNYLYIHMKSHKNDNK